MITITQQNATGFPGLFQNTPTNPLVQNVLPTVYEFGNTFSVNLVFDYVPDDEEDTITDIQILSLTVNNAVPGVTITLVNDHTINFTGRIVDIFNDSYYRFLMPDNTLKILPKETNEFFLALVEYKPPSIKRTTLSYSLTLGVNFVGATGGVPSSTFSGSSSANPGSSTTDVTIPNTGSISESSSANPGSSTTSVTSTTSATSESYDAETYFQVSQQYHSYYSTSTEITADEALGVADAVEGSISSGQSITISVNETIGVADSLSGTVLSSGSSQINTIIGVTQDVAWYYDIAVNQFRNVLAKGVI